MALTVKPHVPKDEIILALVQQNADSQRDLRDANAAAFEYRREYQQDLHRLTALHANAQKALEESIKRFNFLKERIPAFKEMSLTDFEEIYRSQVEENTYDSDKDTAKTDS